MTSITFKIDNKNAIRMFERAVSAVQDSSEALKKVRSYQLQQIDEAFKVSGKNIIGESWKPLKPSTIKEKLKSGFITRILERTGKMRNSFKSIELGKTVLKITSVGVDYFRKHQLGENGSTFSPGVPRRQMLGHSPAMIERTMKIFSDFIHNKIKNG